MALHCIVRNLHEEGRKITFPVPNAVDNICSKRNNLPSNPKELLMLVDEVFERREENLDLQEVYREFVQVYGRVVFDPKKPSPLNFAHTRFTSSWQMKYTLQCNLTLRDHRK